MKYTSRFVHKTDEQTANTKRKFDNRKSVGKFLKRNVNLQRNAIATRVREIGK